MIELTFQDIRDKGLLLYEYIRGSHAYGMATAESDKDYGGIFIVPKEQLFGLAENYQDEVADERHDTCWWEIGKYMRLLLKSSPIVLEALYIPEDSVVYEHPLITELKSHRDMFLTKQCFKAFGQYAISQIEKSRGQNKKIMMEVEKVERRIPLDFIYTPKGQGSQNIRDWLADRGFDQRNVGLVHIPNMKDTYGVFYDFGQHISINGITKEYFCDYANHNDKFLKYCFENLDFSYGSSYPIKTPEQYSEIMEKIWEKNHTPKGGYHGIISPDYDSNSVRCSSVIKGDEPLCHIIYNQTAYEQECARYKSYLEWEKTRNKARYENNLNGLDKENPQMFYDAKNMSHCFRLIQMGIEVAQGKGMNICRTGIDADFLLDIRKRKYTYDELMGMLDIKKQEMINAMEQSTIAESIDPDIVNDMLISIRKKYGY